VSDPNSKTGAEVQMSPARRKYYQQQVDALGTQAKDIESQRQQLRQNFKLGEYAPAQPAAAAPAQPQQGPPPNVVKTMPVGKPVTFRNGQVYIKNADGSVQQQGK
jgi:hypothetical protein